MVKNTKIWENPIDHSMSRGQVCLMWLRKASGTIQNNNCWIPTIKSYFIEDFELVPNVEENFVIHSGDFTRIFDSLEHRTEIMVMRCSRICHVPKAIGWKAKVCWKLSGRRNRPNDRDRPPTSAPGLSDNVLMVQRISALGKMPLIHNICDSLPKRSWRPWWWEGSHWAGHWLRLS